MDVEYILNGPVGETCIDCVNFRHNVEDPSKGTCFGREVAATGRCKFFKKKTTRVSH
ncbi:MAG: hypothetical protein JW778_01005 [Candidatus Altiarchaeota archaeon]|nr:hypothetical protein [Candidatus Altiarchaeota archaeon]